MPHGTQALNHILSFFQGEEHLKTSICTFLSVLSHLDIITQNLPEKVSLNCKKSLNLTMRIELLIFVLIFVKCNIFLISSAIFSRQAGYSVPCCWVFALNVKLAHGTNRTLSYFNLHSCWRVGAWGVLQGHGIRPRGRHASMSVHLRKVGSPEPEARLGRSDARSPLLPSFSQGQWPLRKSPLFSLGRSWL